MISLDRASKKRIGAAPRWRFVLVAGCAALLLSACSGGNQHTVAPAETTATSSAEAQTTTPEPAVEPPTATERHWVKRLHKIRPRIDSAFQRNLNITRASMQSLVRVLGVCKATLKEAGRPGDRFEQAALIARKACDHYEAAARELQQAIAVSDLGGAVVAGTPEETVFNQSLDRAFAAQGNGSNAMLRAEEKADQLLASIEAQSSS
jgi:hypothetical protein